MMLLTVINTVIGRLGSEQLKAFIPFSDGSELRLRPSLVVEDSRAASLHTAMCPIKVGKLQYKKPVVCERDALIAIFSHSLASHG